LPRIPMLPCERRPAKFVSGEDNVFVAVAQHVE
jgi:hypothetical protein